MADALTNKDDGANANAATANSSSSASSFGRDSLREAVAGACAGAFARSIMAPVDRIKLLMQLQGSLGERDKIVNRGSAMQVARNIYHKEGLSAFWRGNSPTVLIQAGQAALNFMFMDWFKRLSSYLVRDSHAAMTSGDAKKYSLATSFVSGALAGGTAITILYPVAFMRTVLAMDVGETSQSRIYPKGMRDVVVKTLRSDGVQGFYRGYGIALASVSLYRMVYLGGYDAIKAELLRQKNELGPTRQHYDASTLSVGQRFLAAQSVSVMASIAHYPLDSVRRRLMMQTGKQMDERQYRNSLDCFIKIFKEEGARGFYLGMGPNLVRSFGAALLLVSYDSFKTMLS